MPAALAAWLDAEAPRSRAERAAAGRAPVMIARRSDPTPPPTEADGPPAPEADVAAFGDDELEPVEVRASSNGRPRGAIRRLPPDARFALIEIPSTGHVVLGFEMDDEDGVLALADRLPPTLARHAAVVLALVTEQLAQAAELGALRAHEAERERFVSTVAHDLRTPLTGLSGYLDLIAEGRVEDPAVEREFVERSRLIVDSMGDLVGDLLEISRLDAGTLRLELRPFSVAEVGNRALAALAPLALERGISLGSDLPPRMRAATGDRREVERILTNLLGNALKFTPEGGHVELAGWFDGSWALLAVRDDGPGVGAARPGQDLRALLPGRRPGVGGRHRPRTGHRPRPRPGDGRRAGRGVGPGHRLELRPDPARSGPGRRRDDRHRPGPGDRRRGGPPRGGRRAPGDPARPAGRSRCEPPARDPNAPPPDPARAAGRSACGRSTGPSRASTHPISPEIGARPDVVGDPTYPRTWTGRAGSWITALTCARRSRSVRLPHDMAGPQGTVTREGRRETGAGTGRAAEDRSDPRGGPARSTPGAARGRSIAPMIRRPMDPREPLPSRVEGLPPLPDAAIVELDRGLASLGLSDLPDPSRRTLADHLRLLAAWNAAINLTAIRDPLAAVRLHLIDSLTAAAVLRDRGIDAFVDLGSGGGFPGIPLAVALPARRALLVDSVAKKARFLGVACAALGLGGRVEAFAGRAEELAADRRHRDRWPAVVARAVGPLVEVVEIGLPLVAPGGLLVSGSGAISGPSSKRRAGRRRRSGAGPRPSSRPTRRWALPATSSSS